MMRILYCLPYVIVGILLVVYDVSGWKLYAVIFLMVFALLFQENYYLYVSRNFEKIERHFKKAKPGTLPYFLYRLSFDEQSEMDEAYQHLIKTMTTINQLNKEVCGTIYWLYKKDLEKAKQYAERIQQKSLKEYYEAIILIEKGKLDEARNHFDRMRSKKLKEIIEIELLVKENKTEQAKKLADEFLLKARGLLLYSMTKHMKNLFPTEIIAKK